MEVPWTNGSNAGICCCDRADFRWSTMDRRPRCRDLGPDYGISAASPRLRSGRAARTVCVETVGTSLSSTAGSRRRCFTSGTHSSRSTSFGTAIRSTTDSLQTRSPRDRRCHDNREHDVVCLVCSDGSRLWTDRSGRSCPDPRLPSADGCREAFLTIASVDIAGGSTRWTVSSTKYPVQRRSLGSAVPR